MKEPKTFSFSEYADEFDQHITQSIRGYPDLRDDVVGISKYFIESDSQVLDIGCSEGTLLERIEKANTHHNSVDFIGCEINRAFTDGWSKPEREYRSYSSAKSKDASEVLHDRWEKLSGGKITLVCADFLDWIRRDEQNYEVDIPPSLNILQPNNLSFVVSLFTMQFLSEKYRLEVFHKIYDNLVDGGAFLTSEKIFAQNAKVQDMMDNLYYDFKRKSFSEKEILDKEQELRHLAKLTTENLLLKQLRFVGFRGIQVFWKNHNFIGVLAMKRHRERWEEEEPIRMLHQSDDKNPWGDLSEYEITMSILFEPQANNIEPHLGGEFSFNEEWDTDHCGRALCYLYLNDAYRNRNYRDLHEDVLHYFELASITYKEKFKSFLRQNMLWRFRLHDKFMDAYETFKYTLNELLVSENGRPYDDPGEIPDNGWWKIVDARREFFIDLKKHLRNVMFDQLELPKEGEKLTPELEKKVRWHTKNAEGFLSLQEYKDEWFLTKPVLHDFEKNNERLPTFEEILQISQGKKLE